MGSPSALEDADAPSRPRIPAKRQGKPTKVSFYGHFGSLNPGNEGTFLAILDRLRHLFPDCDFCCICSDPELVVERDGIEAVPISDGVVKIWDRQLRFDRRLKLALTRVGQEFEQYFRAFRTLKGTEMLVIPGTGLLTDAFGLSSWGPHNMFKWSLMAKLRGCRVIFVSVGAGPIDGTLGRFLVKSALSLADYRSYRDYSSMSYLNGIGFSTEHDQIYPDLVFSLPEVLMPPDENRIGSRRVVGLGLMVYAENYSVGNKARDTYKRYLESVVAFAQWLLMEDYDIRLLLGDGDSVVIEEFEFLLRARLGAYDEERVTYEPCNSVQETLSQLAATDFAVVTRFHNALFALLLRKPVIAISFHHKCASLMDEMGLTAYCHDIAQMSTSRLIEQFQELETNRETVRIAIGQRVEESRRALNEQYDFLFDGK